MSFQRKRLNDGDMDRLFLILLKGLEENAGLDGKRKIVNSIPCVQKYKLLQRFLSNEEDLSEDIRMKCLPIFLDERTKLIAFEANIFDVDTIKSILEIIPRYSPNIETVDLRRLRILCEIKKNFKTFLKQTTQLKSLLVKCDYENCAIRDLLLEEDFNRHDEDVKIGLLKIQYFDAYNLNSSECSRLLKLLPNLKSLGMYQPLSVLLPIVDDDNEIVKKLSNLTEFKDQFTSLQCLECFSKFCPNAKKISLWHPETKVIENLCKFRLLTEIVLVLDRLDSVSELISLLKQIGNQIKYLSLFTFDLDEIELDPDIFKKICRELSQLVINDDIFYI